MVSHSVNFLSLLEVFQSAIEFIIPQTLVFTLELVILDYVYALGLKIFKGLQNALNALLFRVHYLRKLLVTGN